MEHNLADKRFYIRSLDVGSARHDHHTLHEIPELAHIAGPIMSRQDIERLLRDCTRTQSLLSHVHLDKMPYQRRNILAAVAKRRHIKGQNGQPKIEVLAERAFPDLINQ